MNKQTTNNNQKNNEWSKREIGALWKKDGPTQKYLSGYLTIDELGTQQKVNVVVFSNKNKSKDTAPDFRIYISKEKTNASEQTTSSEKVVSVQNVKPFKQVPTTKSTQKVEQVVSEANGADEELL
jgi:hypothetical protein